MKQILTSRAIHRPAGVCNGGSVAFGSTPETVIDSYISFRDRLTLTYGMPTRIQTSIKPGCRTIDTLARRLETQDAEFSAVWNWNDKGTIYLTPASGKSVVGIIIRYDKDAGVRL
jgi:hypothetical protein